MDDEYDDITLSEEESFDVDDESSEDIEITSYNKALKSFDLLGGVDNNYAKIIIIPDDERTTSERIQRYEMVEAIGIRATQIERGSPIFTNVDGLYDPILMAKKEFFDRQSPLILTRAKINNRGNKFKLVEEWKVREMTYPITFRKFDYNLLKK